MIHDSRRSQQANKECWIIFPKKRHMPNAESLNLLGSFFLQLQSREPEEVERRRYLRTHHPH